MEMTIAQILIEEGRQEGALSHARKTLVSLGRKRFGSPDEATLASLNVLTLDRLDRLTELLDEVSSWEELLRAH